MDYIQKMIDRARQINAQEQAYQEKIAKQCAYIHEMYVNVCNFVDYLCGDNADLEITKNEGGKQSGNKIKVQNKLTGNFVTISTPHTYHCGDYTIGFWVKRNGVYNGYRANYDDYKQSISEIL